MTSPGPVITVEGYGFSRAASNAREDGGFSRRGNETGSSRHYANGMRNLGRVLVNNVTLQPATTVEGHGFSRATKLKKDAASAADGTRPRVFDTTPMTRPVQFSK